MLPFVRVCSMNTTTTTTTRFGGAVVVCVGSAPHE